MYSFFGNLLDFVGLLPNLVICVDFCMYVCMLYVFFFAMTIFLSSKAKQALVEGQIPQQELEEGPKSRKYLLVYLKRGYSNTKLVLVEMTFYFGIYTNIPVITLAN